MSIICSKYHSTRNFSYKDKCFVAEASDLGSITTPHDGRVYDDACDVGFILVSEVTGDSVLFVQDGVDMNGDEIAGWRYKPTHVSGSRPGQWIPVRCNISIKALSVLIIND